MIRVASVSAPFDRPAVLRPAVGLLRRAAAVGLLQRPAPVEVLDLALIREIAASASDAGVGRDAAIALLAPQPRADRLAGLITRLDQALLASPLPGLELAELLRVLEPDALAGLLGISTISLRRYAAGTRAVPDTVAARAHWLALVVGDLAGAYNEIGIRRWFDRPRTALDGRSPRQALGAGWDPEDPSAARVAELAAALAGGGAAT